MGTPTFKRIAEEKIMADTVQKIGNDFHWTAGEVFLSVLMGVASVLGVWLLTGLLIMLFMM